MMSIIDTSVLIDVLRGKAAAKSVLRDASRTGTVHASEVARVEVLAGMRPHEEEAARTLLDVLTWHPLDPTISEIAGELGRTWLPGNRGIDTSDLIIAATAVRFDAALLTRNVKHFPMFDGLSAPY